MVHFRAETREIEELARAYEAARRNKVKLPIRQMARRAKSSVRKNFQMGGRPVPWAGLVNRTGKPLLKTRKLYGSIKHRILRGRDFQIYSTDDPGKVGAQDRGRVNYTITPKRAPQLHWQVHGEWRIADVIINHNIPARPFMHLQVEDVDWMVKRIDESVARHLRKHKVAQ